jgi:hypothetical protein
MISIKRFIQPAVVFAAIGATPAGRLSASPGGGGWIETRTFNTGLTPIDPLSGRATDSETARSPIPVGHPPHLIGTAQAGTE